MPRKTKSAAPSMPPTLAAAKKPSNVTSKPAMSSEKVVDSDIESDLSDSSSSSSEPELDDIAPLSIAVPHSSPSKPQRTTDVPTEPQTPNACSPKTFKPPSGFFLHEASQDLSSIIDSLSSRTILQGKEVWYVTAPASVSLEALSDISLDDSSKEATTRYQGVDYYIKLEEAHSNDLRLLIPRSARSEYQSASLPFSRSLRLQRVPTSAPLAPPTDQEPEPLTSPVKAAPRVARPQPPRLKMRYRPFGAAESESDDEASESGAQNSGSVEGTRFRIPVGFEDVVENRKRKHDANGTGEDDMPNGHRKKVKRVSFVDSEVAPSTTAAAQGLMHSPMPDSSPTEKEKAKQEKRDRKQERRKAREARRSEHNEDMGMDLGGTNGQIEQSNEQMGEQRHGSQEQEGKHHIPSKNQTENGALGGPDAAEKRAKKERRREKRRKDKEEGVGSTKGGPARRKTEKKEKKDKRHREKIQIDGRA